MGMKKYVGNLEAFFETGCEGFIWKLIEDGKSGYEALVSLDAGDRLKIYGKNETVVFDGIIKEDFKTGWTEYPKNPGHGQPAALGYWIHWTQRGWKPDEWARLFLDACRAEVIKSKESVNRVVFSKPYKKSSCGVLYFNESDIDDFRIPQKKKLNLIEYDLVAAHIQPQILVFKEYLELKIIGNKAVFCGYDKTKLCMRKVLVLDKKLIKEAYRDLDLVYTE